MQDRHYAVKKLNYDKIETTGWKTTLATPTTPTPTPPPPQPQQQTCREIKISKSDSGHTFIIDQRGKQGVC